MTRALYPEWPRSDEYSIAPVPAVDGYAAYITIAWSPGMRRDFRDVRFREPSTLRRNYCWLQSKTDGSTATFGIRLYQNQKRVEVVYSNGAAAAESSIADTFDYGEDFEGGALTGWTITNASGGNSCTTSTDQAASGTHSMKLVQAMLDSSTNIRASHASPLSAAVWEFSFYDDGDTNAFKIARVSSGSSILGGWGVFTGASATKYVYHDSAYSYTASSVDRSNGWHSFKAVRFDKHLLLYIDGTELVDLIVSGTFDTIIFDGYGANPNYATTYYVDNVRIRKWAVTEPTFTKVRSGLNPWSPLVNRPAALFDVPFDWSDFDAVKERALVSYTVRRSASDVMYSADVTFHDLIPQGTNFTRVKLIEPDHNGVDRLIFFGFLPAQTSTIQAAKNSTNYKGWDYGYYIASAYPPISWCTMPSTTTSPGQWIYARMSYPTHWTDIADPSRNLFDLSNVDVDAPAAWGTDALPVRDIVCPTTSSHMAVYQAVAAKLGCIFYTRWIDVGKTPTIGHQDPAYRIIRKEAEDYDAGGEGVGYHDTTAANLGGAYRKDGVDIEYFASEAGYNVGWIRDGEWLQYTVNFPVADTYVARFRTASAAATGARSFKVYLDGALVDTISVDGTGSYSAFAWNTDTCDIVIGTAGNHTIKLLFDNAGDDTTDLLHMNLAAMEFTPTPPDDGTVPPTIVPALYWCDEADLDDALGLPIIEIPPYDPTLAGAVKYAEDMSDVANVVSVRYHLGTGATPDEILETTDWIADRNGLEHWIEHVETVETPITTAQAVVLRDALLAYFAEDWGTVTANFTRRPDLQLYQRLWFRGHAQIPEYEDDGTTPVLFRIVDISYSVGLAKCDVAITAVPVRKFAIEKQIARTRAPDPATEIEAIARSVLKTLPPALTGTAWSVVGTGSVAVVLDRGGTITARGVAANGSRVICTWAEGIGYVASVIAAA